MKTVIMLLVFMSTMAGLEPEIILETLMTVPKQTKDLVKKFEGLKLTPYKDSVGIATVGYGHVGLTPPPCDGCTVISEFQAENMLDNDLEHVLSLIQSHIKVNVTDNQLAALLSFGFNLGPNALINSTLLKELNSGNMEVAADEFLKWTHAKGQVLPGLVIRRSAERKLFLTPDTEESIDVAKN